jgi:hypothetical protein
MIPTSEFTHWFFLLLAETLGVADTPHGRILDNGQSGLLGTINTLSAEVASAAPTPDQATIASHCGHILFLLQYFAAYERGETPRPIGRAAGLLAPSTTRHGWRCARSCKRPTTI